MTNNSSSTSYMPDDAKHSARLALYDQGQDLWVTNHTWRFLSNHAFTAVSAIVSVKTAMFFWRSLHFSGIGMMGASLGLFTLVAEIYRNHGLLWINDEAYSLFGYDHLSNDVRHINDVLTYFFPSKKVPTDKSVNPALQDTKTSNSGGNQGASGQDDAQKHSETRQSVMNNNHKDGFGVKEERKDFADKESHPNRPYSEFDHNVANYNVVLGEEGDAIE